MFTYRRQNSIFMGKELTKMKKILLSVIALLSLGVLFAAPAGAATCKPSPANHVYCCNDTPTSIDFKCPKPTKENPELSITQVILMVVNFLAIGVGIAVVGGIVWGSLWYTTANGNAGQAQQGISIIINAVIGLVLFLFMWALINFLVPGGLFR